MCTGYRFDILMGEKVEGLCSCTCHNAVSLMVYDLDRFRQASETSSQLDELTKIDG